MDLTPVIAEPSTAAVPEPIKAPAVASKYGRRIRKSRLGEAGTSRGLTLAPGSDDDGWIIPHPVRLADGSHVQLYKDGEALHAAFAAIRSARSLICLEVYIFHSDDTGRAFAELLGEKARQGVRVHVIYDSFGSWDSDAAMFAGMRRAGAQLAEFHPIRPWDCLFSWRPVNRDHRKLLVIDDHVAGLGGLNLGLEYGSGFVQSRSKCELWRDSAIGIVGPAALHFRDAFARMWRYVTSGGRIRTAEMIFNLDVGRRRKFARPAVGLRKRGDHQGELKHDAIWRALADPPLRLRSDLGILASVPTLSSPLQPFLHHLVRDARHSVEMTIAYFAPSDEMIDQLCRAARRGVRVRLMLPGNCDMKLLRIAARSFYATLLAAGVEIFERQTAVLHAKCLVIDSRLAVIGSTNLDYRSFEYNCELSAVIHSQAFARQLHALFENDALFAERIDAGHWQNRPIRDRMVQWAVSRARYVL